MQLEIYNLIAEENRISISLEAICDSYSSLLWDIEFYQCGCFEVYIAASPQNVSIFQRGRIVARSDDAQHFGIIESLQLETDAEKGDYLTVTGRFLACLLERRIIYPTITANGSYEDIVRKLSGVGADIRVVITPDEDKAQAAATEHYTDENGKTYPLLAFSFTYTATQADGSQVKGSFTDNYYLDE